MQVAEVKSVACALPAQRDIPLSRFSIAEIQQEIIDQNVVSSISASTVWRWLHHDAIRPWFHRSWIKSRDPQFVAKATPVLDLYEGVWEGAPLGADDYVISTDEKTSIQARGRDSPTTPPRPSQSARVEHTYRRGGALAYLAAWDVHRGAIMGRCEATTGIEPFHRLVDLVMTQEPYASARRVFWIADNGSSHRGRAAAERLQSWYSQAILVNLPVHASWLNQIEIYFSILQRKALTPNDLPTTEAVAHRILGFQERYNRDAEPFHWRFTKADLMRRIQRAA